MSKFTYQCINCNEELSDEGIIYLCPNCSKSNINTQPPKGILKVNYNYNDLMNKNSSSLYSVLLNSDFIDLLPIKSIGSLPFLKTGNTPLYKLNSIDGKKLSFELFLKDDSQNPTFSFKDRASSLVSAWAKEKGINTIAAASTGNAGSSLAGICASQKQKAIIFVPETAPKAKLTQIVMYGAQVVPVAGTYDDAFDLSIEASNKFGWYNRNTAYNPFTIEGKKTVSFELFEQLKLSIPDRIFVSSGDGVIISGVYKGFEDLLQLKIIDKMPTIVCVQAEGSNNIIANINNNEFKSTPSNTVADSIAVDIPRNFYMAKDYILKYKGEWQQVSDKEILNASKLLSSNYGIFAEPAATAAFAGLLKFTQENKIPKQSKNVVLLTGNGLKDLNAVQNIISIPGAIKPDIDNVSLIIK